MKCRGGKEQKTKTNETTDGAEGLQRKKGVARSLGERLQTDLLLLLLRFIHTERVVRPGTEDKLCVNHFFSSPLHSQLYGNKAQNRSGDLRLCISSGSRPVFFFFFSCGGGSVSLPHLEGDTFPFQIVRMCALCSNYFIFDLCF